MKRKSNKFKSITKGLMAPNIIFPAAYILFSAKSCPDFSSDAISHLSSTPDKTQFYHASERQEACQEATQDDGTTALLGKGTLLNIDGYTCGVFVTDATKEAFLIKLPSEGGWMALIEQDQKGVSDTQTGQLAIHYDAVPDPCIIKIDYRLLERLGGPLSEFSQSSVDKETFWHKIADDPSWRDIALFCKEPISDRSIFTYDGIASSMKFTKEIDESYNRARHRINQKLSISSSIASAPLKHFEKTGFLLVKGKPTLGKLLKNMLEMGSTWGKRTVAIATKDYIICPSLLNKDMLAFNLDDLTLPLQGDYVSLLLKDYRDVYVYLKDGAYNRLITLDNIDAIDHTVPSSYYWSTIKPVPQQQPSGTPSEQPNDQAATNTDNITDTKSEPPITVDPSRTPNLQADEQEPPSINATITKLTIGQPWTQHGTLGTAQYPTSTSPSTPLPPSPIQVPMLPTSEFPEPPADLLLPPLTSEGTENQGTSAACVWTVGLTEMSPLQSPSTLEHTEPKTSPTLVSPPPPPALPAFNPEPKASSTLVSPPPPPALPAFNPEPKASSTLVLELPTINNEKLQSTIKKLRKVNVDAASNKDPRNLLLQDIRNGKPLKKGKSNVKEAKEVASANNEKGNFYTQSLMDHILARRVKMGYGTGNEDKDEEDHNDWE